MKVSLFGSYGEYNLGDEAIADALVSYLQDQYQASCVMFTHRPTKSAKIHRYKHLHMRPMLATGFRSLWNQCRNGEWKRSMSLLKQSDVIVIGGGGIFHEKEVDQRGLSPLFVWFLRLFMFRFFVRKPFIVLGVGVSRLRSYWSRLFLRYIFRWSDQVILRDRASLRYSGGLDVAQLATDIVWSKRCCSDKKLSNNIDGQNLQIGLQIRKSVGMDEDRFLNTLSAVCEICVEELHAYFHCFPLSTDKPDDRVLINNFIAQTNYQSHFKMTVCASPDRVRDEFSQLGLMISARYHGLIIAMQNGVIPISLSYASKTRELMRLITEFAHSRYDKIPMFSDDFVLPCFDILRFDAEDLVRAIRFCKSNYDILQTLVCDFAQHQHEFMRKVLDHCFSLYLHSDNS